MSNSDSLDGVYALVLSCLFVLVYAAQKPGFIRPNKQQNNTEIAPYKNIYSTPQVVDIEQSFSHSLDILNPKSIGRYCVLQTHPVMCVRWRAYLRGGDGS